MRLLNWLHKKVKQINSQYVKYIYIWRDLNSRSVASDLTLLRGNGTDKHLVWLPVLLIGIPYLYPVGRLGSGKTGKSNSWRRVARFQNTSVRRPSLILLHLHWHRFHLFVTANPIRFARKTKFHLGKYSNIFIILIY